MAADRRAPLAPEPPRGPRRPRRSPWRAAPQRDGPSARTSHRGRPLERVRTLHRGDRFSFTTHLRG
ncbi:hypothetical protein ACF1AU_00845 [Streptomyces rubrogriseus]|uniref:hypothetical protein n=1 Tax=Streptomyces rubrogriseus TaxID=194673 RepID=UPI0036FFE0C6